MQINHLLKYIYFYIFFKFSQLL